MNSNRKKWWIMKIRKSKITSLEYSVTLTTEDIIEAIKDKFEHRLTLEQGIPSGDIDRTDFIVSISQQDGEAVATISYRRDQGSRPEGGK